LLRCDWQVYISVANKPLEEFEHNAKTYVVVDYKSDVSYHIPVEDESPFGEMERQNWPFTPFRINIKSHCPVPDYLSATVRLDGVKAAQHIVDGNKSSLEFQGIQGRIGFDSDLKEFCFSPPRPRKRIQPTNFDPEDKVSAQRLSELGSIVVEIHKVQKHSSREEYISSNPVFFSDANKQVLARFSISKLLFPHGNNDLQDCKAASATAASRCTNDFIAC
jgi:hypothetical protein